MHASDADILIIPGLGNSGPDHWQSRWQKKIATARRVEQEDWEHPQRGEWAERIAKSVGHCERPVILVAHSLGVIAAVHAAEALEGMIAGGFFVAPPSERTILAHTAIDGDFAPPPLTSLSFPSVVVGSRDDPFAFFDETEAMARAWGAELCDAGFSGHINAESGHGPWPEGLMRFAGFLKKL